jgi:putative SOS response-associated peptidase YedK
MCGRFAITLPSDAMAHLFDAQPANDLPHVPNFNVCPTNQVHSVVSGETGRRLVAMRWGFLPHWYKSPSDGPLLINARGETLAEKPAFRDACRTRRCLIPVSGFYEWTKDPDGKRLPWYIQTDASVIAFAGVWQQWHKDAMPLTTCAIVTVASSGPLSDIHHRMPLRIAPEDWPLWLGEEGKGAARLMTGSPGDVFSFHRVDPRVNSNRAEGPELIDPLDLG